MNPHQNASPIASHFQDNYAKWDSLNCTAFVDVLTDLLSAFSTAQEWQTLPLYEKWLRRRYASLPSVADEVFTQGDYYQLVTNFITTLNTIGIH